MSTLGDVKPVDQLRNDLAQVGEERAEHDERGAELEGRLAHLLAEAQRHPDLSMTEAATLAGIRRRATAYELARQAGD